MKVQFYSIVLFSVIINSNFLFAQVTINDEFFNNQWYLNMQGNDNTRADIRILDAWSRTMGSSIQKIADIEDQASGFPNSSHEDLINRINVHGIGTDGEHATQIAGILVANHNNKGIAGINKFASLNSYIFSSTNNWADWDDRILDAISDGNKIINISQGTYARLPDVSIKLAQAYSNNIVTVVSAGNNNSSLTNPAKNLSVIAVGASTKDNTRASWSNFGPQIEFLAPGGSVLNDPLNDKNIYTTSLDGSYKYSSGTSMAAPIVTGAASLLLAYKPSLSNEDVKNILRYSCDKLPQMQGADFTDECGYGRINLKKAMQFLEAPYTIYHGNAILTKLYDNIGMSFTNDPILPFGIYYGDAYKLSIDREDLNYLEIPMAWLPKGYSPYFPNNSQDYLNSTISSNSIHLSTFFYYIEHDEVGNLINMWVPYNPPLIYSILGKPLVAPVIASMTQSPVPIYKGTYGYVYCNLSQGNGNLTYNWFSYDQPSYVSIVPEGYRCKIIYHNTESIPPIDAPTWNFGCTVSNAPGAGWSDTKTFVPSLNSDPNGCPTLAFEQNGILTDENPLLITSMSNPEKDVTDYYLINTPLSPVDNRINLTIHEPQTEHTWFDNVSLLETRANPDETIVVNDEGQVINYKGVLTARILLNGETDITQNLLELDSLSVELNPGDRLTISRNAVEGDGNIVINGAEGIPISKRIPAMLMNVITQKQSVENEKEIITESTPFTNFFLRPNKSTISKKLRNLPTGTIEITVNKKLTLDYFVFVSDLRTARTRELPLVSAVHSVNGDIKTKLTVIDQNYSEMFPTERIDLSFSTTTKSGNRAYILKSVGRYETDTTFQGKQNNLSKLNEVPTIPTENKLYDNYPNPFNPTTKIKYSIKESGLVQIKVYDILGKEITTLVNERKDAGSYTIDFNASALPSGVYIYQLTTPGFTQARKMILAK